MRNHLRLAIGGCASVAALSVAAALWLWLDARDLQAAARAAIARSEAYAQRGDEQPSGSIAPPDKQAVQALAARVQEVNQLSLSRGWSPERVLDWCAAHLPAQARLIRFSHHAARGQATIQLQLTQADVLADLVSTFQQEPQFSSVVMVRQESDRRTNGLVVELQFRTGTP